VPAAEVKTELRREGTLAYPDSVCYKAWAPRRAGCPDIRRISPTLRGLSMATSRRPGGAEQPVLGDLAVDRPCRALSLWRSPAAAALPVAPVAPKTTGPERMADLAGGGLKLKAWGCRVPAGRHRHHRDLVNPRRCLGTNAR